MLDTPFLERVVKLEEWVLLHAIHGLFLPSQCNTVSALPFFFMAERAEEKPYTAPNSLRWS